MKTTSETWPNNEAFLQFSQLVSVLSRHVLSKIPIDSQDQLTAFCEPNPLRDPSEPLSVDERVSAFTSKVTLLNNIFDLEKYIGKDSLQAIRQYILDDFVEIQSRVHLDQEPENDGRIARFAQLQSHLSTYFFTTLSELPSADQENVVVDAIDLAEDALMKAEELQQETSLIPRRLYEFLAEYETILTPDSTSMQAAIDVYTGSQPLRTLDERLEVITQQLSQIRNPVQLSMTAQSLLHLTGKDQSPTESVKVARFIAYRCQALLRELKPDSDEEELLETEQFDTVSPYGTIEHSLPVVSSESSDEQRRYAHRCLEFAELQLDLLIHPDFPKGAMDEYLPTLYQELQAVTAMLDLDQASQLWERTIDCLMQLGFTAAAKKFGIDWYAAIEKRNNTTQELSETELFSLRQYIQQKQLSTDFGYPMKSEIDMMFEIRLKELQDGQPVLNNILDQAEYYLSSEALADINIRNQKEQEQWIFDTHRSVRPILRRAAMICIQQHRHSDLEKILSSPHVSLYDIHLLVKEVVAAWKSNQPNQ